MDTIRSVGLIVITMVSAVVFCSCNKKEEIFMPGKRLDYIDFDTFFMTTALIASERSKDPRTRVGAVIVKDNYIQSIGYNGTPKGMDDDIRTAYIEASKRSGIPYIIPSGEAIRLAREKYGDVLDRDGYHLNEMGRTLTGILWVFYLTGRTDLDISSFVPSGHSYDDVTPGVSKETVKELVEIAKKALENNKGYNLYGKM